MKRIKKHIGWHYLDDPRHLFFVIAIAVGGVFGFRYSLGAYPEIFRAEIKIEKFSSVHPKEPITVEFSQSVLRDSYEKNVSVHPEEKIELVWSDSGRKLTISPQKSWKAGQDYSINFSEGKSVMLTRVESAKIEFSTLDYPKIEKVYPADGEKDIVIDLEEPILVSFSSGTEEFALDFSLSPERELAIQSYLSGTQFKIMPKEKLGEGEKYTLSVRARYRDIPDSENKEIYRGSFETLPPAPVTWEKDLTLRVEQAKKYTRPKKETGKYVDINLASQVLSMIEEGKVVNSFIISSGKRGMDTPRGEFSILTKRPRPWSKKYALYMPWFMGFTREGHGIHELPEWPGGYKEGASHLGIPVSHGCVRLGIGPAKTLYEWTEVGTPVVVY